MANRWRAALALATAVTLAVAVGAAEQDKPLTNTDVVALVEAGVDPDLIVSKIQQAPLAVLDVSTEKIIELSKRGIPKPVIDAMLQRMNRNDTARRPAVWPTAGVPNVSRVIRVEMVTNDKKVDLVARSGVRSSTYVVFGALNWLNINGQRADVRTTASLPTIRVFCEGDSNPIGVVRLESNKKDRSLKLTSMKLYSMNSIMRTGVDPDWVITDKFSEISPGVWDAQFAKPLPKGEYALVNVHTSQMWDFAIDAP